MKKLLSLFILSVTATLLIAQSNVFEINLKKKGATIQPTMYGLFFEDINYAADGGLYGELIKNRSFEFPQNLLGWKTFGNVSVQNDGPFENNPHYVRLAYSGHDHKHTGLENEGFFGVGVFKDKDYRFSVWARLPQNSKQEKIRVELVQTNNPNEHHSFVSQELIIDSKDWKKYEITLRPSRTDAKAILRIFLTSRGPIDLEHISLFPVDTWKGHENGLRKDIAQALADLKPGVFRFPGGCIVEGTDIDTRYDWKKSVGPVENRPLNENRWHYTFAHRFYPDYYQSYGLGFYEYFLFSEEIGAEPLPVLNVGLACQYQNNDMKAHIALDQLEPYIQDALDLIEFANGGTETKWGKLRADMGHPEPFNMKYIGIGNEQWGPEYVERLKPFMDVLKKKHPEIQVIGGSGPGSEGKEFEYLWPEMKKLKVDLVDEHFYRPESWFLAQGARYDSYDRKGPKVFAGEYACHGNGRKYNHFNTAILEAAFMTGLERNADIVHMATYAPLLAHVEGWQWRPDLVWFDNMSTFKTTSYYVQQLYTLNLGTNVLSLTMDKKPVTGADDQKGLFASAVWDKNTNEVIVKVVNTSNQNNPVSLIFNGLQRKESLTSGTVTLLQSDDIYAENSIETPNKIAPVEEKIEVNGNSLSVDVAPNTFALYRIKVEAK